MADVSLTPQIDAVCDEFDAAAERGAAPRIEDFLANWQGAARDLLLRHLLQREAQRFAVTGETLPIQSYRDRFSDQVAVVDALFDTSEEVLPLIQRLELLGLIPAELQQRLQSEIASGNSTLTRETLCRRLVQQQYLTEYQSQFIQHGEPERLVLGEYVIVDKIGQGGMGIVYRARQPALNRLVALKTILSRDSAGSEEVRRFRQEAESAARLRHPGIVSVFNFGEADGVHFFAMEYVAGTSLQAKLTAAALAPQAAAKLLRRLAESVAYAHAQGVIHRDLKPANILLEQDGAPRITDFGLAKLVDREGETVTGAVLGTPSYMPPEQALGNAGAVREAADVYSLGAILYACLCGHPPFKAETVMATLKLVVEQPAVPPRQFNAQIPADLETICLKCLEKNPEQRYESAASLQAELDRFLNGEPILARPVGRIDQFRRWCRCNRLVATLSATALLLLIVGTIVSSYFAVLASGRAARAEEGTRIAVETLESVVFQMQEKLGSIPAARDARREVLKQAMQELQKLSELKIQSPRLDLGRAAILSRYAAIIFDIGTDESLGSLDMAEKYLEQARELFAKCHTLDPTNRRLRLEWAFALAKSGDLAVTRGKMDRARDFTSQATARYRQLLSEEPNEKLWKKELIYVLSVAGDVSINTGDLARAFTEFSESRDLVRPLFNQYPESPDFHESLIVATEKLADVKLRQGDKAAARKLYEENLQTNLDYLKKDPTDALRYYSLSFCYERLAEFEVREGRPQTGANFYLQEVDTMLQAIAADQKNARYQQEVHMPLGKLMALYGQLKRPDDAAAVQKRVQETLQRARKASQQTAGTR